MFCPYCGKEMDDKSAYCGFCGAKNETVKSSANPTYKDTSSSPSEKSGSYTYAGPTGAQQTGAQTAAAHSAPKKKSSAGKIILIVFLCCTLLVLLCFGFIFGIFSLITKNDGWDTDNSIVDEFDDNYNEGSYFGSFDSSDKFTPGETDVEKNSYKSDFGALDFSLPSTFETYSSRDIAKLYDDNAISSGEVDNYLTVYDFYSKNNISGTQISIDYYNADYYSDIYDSFAEYKDDMKESIEDYGDYYNATVSFAEDSSIVLNGNKYSQIAARIVENDTTIYEYAFMREVDGYYMKITVFANDLNNVGEIIEILNGESK